MLQAVFIKQDGSISSDDSVGEFINLDEDKYTTVKDCGTVRFCIYRYYHLYEIEDFAKFEQRDVFYLT